MSKKEKIVVAMSGGVDSSVAAALLVDQGYQVQGVSLRLWEGNAGPRVCSDHRGAQAVAAQIGIPHTLIDLRAQFAEAVVKPFAENYLRGRTPNPCIACNRDFKLGNLLAWARQQGADYVATGHYARVERHAGRWSLARAADRGKDQSYFLFGLSQEQLAGARFPLGAMHKAEVRALARRLELAAAERPDSQDICFGDYKSLVASYAPAKEVFAGDIVDHSGRVLGRHSGIHTVTVGQRRGLGISAAEALYVVQIDALSKRVVVSGKQQLRCAGLIVRSVNWIAAVDDRPCAAAVQIRYGAPALPCVISRRSADSYEVRFGETLTAITPGQAAVFYHGDRLLGGGWIESAIREGHRQQASGESE